MLNDRVLKFLDRQRTLFDDDVAAHETTLRNIITSGKFLVIGGAGSIGHAVAREIFSRNPAMLHIVDISENNLVEVVRDLRSTLGYIDGEFKTFAIDCGGVEFEALVRSAGPYDYVLNLSALKHVRSERDSFTLMRMIEVNILNTVKTIDLTKDGLKKYFCVSTDKAANPVNMMGASKRIMEMYLADRGQAVPISTARFANVAFSNGSLPDGFKKRFDQQQPLSAPSDILRYFVTPKEAGQLCLMSCLLGENGEIFFPNNNALKPISFSSIAKKYLENNGYQPVECASEEDARANVRPLLKQDKWPVYFSKSDTTGEKPCEEFYTDSEVVNLDKYRNIGLVKNEHLCSGKQLDYFLHSIIQKRQSGLWDKPDLVRLFQEMLPEFEHTETGKNLDEKM